MFQAHESSFPASNLHGPAKAGVKNPKKRDLPGGQVSLSNRCFLTAAD
jgi:hypothetical protein